jgi:hypothetical protein
MTEQKSVHQKYPMIINDDAISLYKHILYRFPYGLVGGFLAGIAVTSVRQFPLQAAMRQSLICGIGAGVVVGFYQGSSDMALEKKKLEQSE